LISVYVRQEGAFKSCAGRPQTVGIPEVGSTLENQPLIPFGGIVAVKGVIFRCEMIGANLEEERVI
jgi:hypothetical protein